MAERVLFAASSWKVKEGGVFVALPVAAADCEVKSTDMPFADRNPFERGLLMFLLAGVDTTEQLAELLGVSDPAFIAIMADDLKRAGLIRRLPNGELVPTQVAKDTYLNAGRQDQSHHGKVLYFHDKARGYVIAGPLDRSSRQETVQEHSGATGRVSAGTEGSPFTPRCLLPTMPSTPPPPMQAVHADSGVKQFLKRAASKTSVIRARPSEGFAVSLRNPHWVRLLVRVSPAAEEAGGTQVSAPEGSAKRNRSRSYQVRIADNLDSPHASRQLESLLRSDERLGHLLERELKSVTQRTSPRAVSDPAAGELGITLTPLPQPDDHHQTAPAGPIVIDTSPTATLCRALCDRMIELCNSVHLPLVEDQATVDAKLRSRFQSLGFVTSNDDQPILLPLMPGPAVMHARQGRWDLIENLWLAFAAWVLVEHEDHLRPIAEQLPKLPSTVAEVSWGMKHEAELNDIADHVAALRKVQT